MKKFNDIDPNYRIQRGMTVLNNQHLLNELIHSLQMADQWDKPGADYGYRSHQMQYLVQTEYILGLLEVMECGSHGGFAIGQKDRSLAGRIDWQIRRLR